MGQSTSCFAGVAVVEAAALAGPALSSVTEHSKEPSEPKCMSANTPTVSVAASPALDGSLRSLNVGKWDAEEASCMAVPAPDTPPPGIPQLPQASLTEGKPPRRSLSSRRRSLPRLPSLAEEEMTSPRRRQSTACTNATAQCSIPALPRRHSSVCTAETALHDKKLARYVPDAPHASPPQAELVERPLGRSLKRPPAQQLSDEDLQMRLAIKGFGKVATADDHRRRRALKSALVGSSSVSRARPSARSDCDPAVGVLLERQSYRPTPPFEGLKLGQMLAHSSGVKVYKGVYRGSPVIVRLFKDATWLRSMNGIPLEAAISAAHPHRNLARCSAMRRRGGSSGGDGIWTVTECFGRTLQDAVVAKRFLQAPSLEAHLRKRNLCDALCIAADVAEAMAYLHSMDIVHGRLTPAHVLLAEDASAESGCRAVLTGYGLAHAKPLDVAESPNIVNGAEIAHWSPERLIDASNTPAGDIFAFGMMLVSMLSGEAPWAGRSGPQIVLAAGILRLRPPPPPRVPCSLASLIDLCLRAEPDERPTFGMARAVIRGLLEQDARAVPAA